MCHNIYCKIKYDYIYFFAGLTGTEISIERTYEYIKANELGLVNLLNNIIRFRCSNNKIIEIINLPQSLSKLICKYSYNLKSLDNLPGKLKYLAGSESAMGAFIMDMRPEQSAGQLRDVKI